MDHIICLYCLEQIMKGDFTAYTVIEMYWNNKKKKTKNNRLYESIVFYKN